MLRLTATQARSLAEAAAGWLAAQGLGPGDRIAIAPAAEPDVLNAQRQQSAVLCVVWGALSVGVVPVMANPDLTDLEREHVLTDSEPALVLDSTAALVDCTEHDLRHPLPPFPLGRPMHYTSGTTGRPKGVWAGVLTDAEAAELWGGEIDLWGITADDVTLVHGPMAHSGPLRVALYVLLAGGDVLLPGRFDAARTAEALRTERPTTAFTVPSHLQRLLELGDDLPASPYRLLVHAGAACPPVLKLAVHDWAGADRVWEFYGSTEGQFTAMSGVEWEGHQGSVGRARPDRELRIVDGTIWCCPPASGRFEYWRDPDKTEAAWREADGRRWFTVGDLGRLDDNGYLFIDGRRADLIITGGMNVYPAEVEGALLEFPDVIDAAVYGMPDEHWGQRVCAAVVGDIDVEALTAWLRTRLAGYKRPKEIHLVSGLPHTASGKTKRLAVAEVVAGQ
jgi:acyl-CoA synthetase (AMP-forming)/AMP-acid ligase II